MLLVILVLVNLVIAVVGVTYCVRNYATDSIAELRYMLRSRKSIREELEQAEENEKIKKLKEELEKEIMELEVKINNHWGRRIVRKGPAAVSTFDILDIR